jgi:hypothetical protein
MAEHTPGPYRVEEESSTEKGATAFALYAGSVDLALIARGWLPLAVARANAKLFAAAPDLLAALREFMLVNNRDGYEFDSNEPKLWAMMTAAIAKTTKEQA